MKSLNVRKNEFLRVRNFDLVWLAISIILMISIVMIGSNKVEGKEEVTLTFATLTSPRDHTGVEGMFRFKELVEERSNGIIKVEVYYSGELATKGEALVSMTQAGAIDIIMQTNPVIASVVPTLSVLNLPYIFRDKEHANKVLVSGLLQPYLDELKDHKLITLTFYNEAWRHIFNSKRPIYSPGDLKGLKMRVMETPVNVDTMAAMGGSPTPMAWGEVYLALRNKTVDGLDIQINPIYTNSFYEAGSYLSLTYTFLQQYWYVMNLQKFNSLSLEHQNILLESAKEAGEYSSRLTDESEAKMVGELILKHGVSVNHADVNLFAKATESIYKKYENQFSPELIESIRKY